ncbi:MAG: YraN family protein [Candidatus Magasanikbacteria bacterium]
MSKTKKQILGKWGEEQAALFLIRKRYTIVQRNFSIRGGEVDIIAWHRKKHFGNTLCFIEVKTRSYGIGSAERATGYEKQQKMFNAAKGYCVQKTIPVDTTPIQFEHVSVYVSEKAKKVKIKKFVIPVD